MTKLRVQAQTEFDDEDSDLDQDNHDTLKELLQVAQQLAANISDLEEALREDPESREVAVNLQGQDLTLLEQAMRSASDTFRALSEFSQMWQGAEMGHAEYLKNFFQGK